jgi:hypothetical protein
VQLQRWNLKNMLMLYWNQYPLHSHSYIWFQLWPSFWETSNMAAGLILFHIWYEGLIGFYNFSLLLYNLCHFRSCKYSIYCGKGRLCSNSSLIYDKFLSTFYCFKDIILISILI